MTAAELVGAWSLQCFVVQVDDGRPDLFPLGDDATGLVVYSDDGWMSAVLSRSDRGAGALGGALEDAARAGPEAKGQAFDSYLSYAGRWELADGEVRHHVTHALVPGVVGQVLRRTARLDADTLELSYLRPTRSGAVATYRLSWSRA